MNNLCIIIVFYNPTEQQRIKASLLSKHINVIIVDNSSIYYSLPETSTLRYFALCENRGIAYAQNFGIRQAQKLGFTYILFQDQDSSLSYSNILKLFKEYIIIKKEDARLGAIGPLIINETTGKAYKNELGSNKSKSVSSIISSGMLLEIDTLIKVGPMEEELFIDNVDHEWCWRAKNKGYHVYLTREAILTHNVGNETKQIGKLQIIKSAPIRSYYKFRNNITLLLRAYVPIKWKIKTIGNIIFNYAQYLFLYRKYGKEYIKFASKGIIDALKGKKGSI